MANALTLKLVKIIKDDEQLLSWARYSIRFNGRRADQANDFVGKLNAHKIEIAGASGNTLGPVLAQIEKDDKAGV